MMKTWLLAFALFWSFSAFAAPTNNWEQLKSRIIAEGSPVETMGGLYLTISHRTELLPPVRGHHVDYISTVGFFNAENDFVTQRVESVSETWRVNENGDWDIDQWLIMSDAEGEVLRANHIHLVESPTGSILAYEYVPATEAEKMAKWKETLNAWIERK